MRTNVTSGFSFFFCLYLCALVALLFAADRAHAKRGCSAFGHSCFGGHGKRFDPNVQEEGVHDNGIIINDRNQENERPRLSNELFLDDPLQKFQGTGGRTLIGSRRLGSQKFDPYMFSFIVGHWLASHRRLQHPVPEVNNK